MRIGFGFDIAQMRRGAGSAIDPIAALYGTGMGQIPLHLRPEDATLDGAGNVIGVPNRGGAGATFNAIATEQGILVSGGLFSIAAFGPHLQLASLTELMGARLFFLGKVLAGLPHDPRYIGSLEQATHLRVARATGRISAYRNADTIAVVPDQAIDASTALNLYETEIANGQLRMFLNGVLQQSSPAVTWPDFKVDRIFAGQSFPFAGEAGEVVSMVTDGSAAMDARAATIRQALAAKHGITLP